MALTNQDIDLFYLEVLARHATQAEQATFAALSNSESSAQIRADIATLPEATTFVDPVIRLYQGAFGRVPDTADPQGDTVAAFDTGATSGYWANVNAYRSGISLLALAEAFTHSQEFINLYGSSNVTAALITAYYQHILGRDPASTEVSAWLNAKDSAGHPLDAAQILLGFTQSTEYIGRSQASIDTFKANLAAGIHAGGGLVIPSDYTLTSDHDAAGSVDEGHTITYTLKGPSGDAGNTFAYNFSGSAATLADISGPLSGTVTLDSTGTATITVTVLSDNVTEGSESLVLNIPGLGADFNDQLQVNDTSLSPTVLHFTSTAGETLTGTDGNDTFVGIVDHSAFNDVGTFQNVVDVANGGKGFDTLQLVVNQSNVDIVPNAPGVEELLVTDLAGSNYNLSKMPDIRVIASDGSTGGTMNFFNVQNIVNLDIENSDLGFANFNVTTTTGAGTGAVDVNLVNSGDFALSYFNSKGQSVVTDWTIHASGDNNHIDNLHGAEITKTFTIDGDGSLHLDLTNSEDTSGVTSVDASALQGDFELHDLHANQVDIKGSVGDNDFRLHSLGGANVSIETQDGDDTVNINNLNGNDNNQTFNISTAGGDDQVNINDQNGDNYNVTVDLGSGDNGSALNIGAAATVGMTAGDGNNTINIQIHGDPDSTPVFSASTVNVSVGDGANNVTVNTRADGNGSDQGSKITITGGSGGNTINATADDAAVISVTTLGGDDNITTFADDGASQETVDAGEGNNTVSVTGGLDSVLKVTTGGGKDKITVDGISQGATKSLTVDSGAGDDNITVSWLNSANPTVNVKAGSGDDRVFLAALTAITPNVSLDGGDGTDTLAMQDGSLSIGGTPFSTANLTGKAANFEILEVTNRLLSDVNLIDFQNIGSTISKMVLDDGSNGTHILSGMQPNFTLDIHGEGQAGGGEFLTVLMNNAAINTHDVLNLNLFNNSNVNNTVQDHGGLGTGGLLGVGGTVEQFNISSSQDTAATGLVNVIDLLSVTQDIDLHISGNTTLDLSGSNFGGVLHVTNVDAATMTGGIIGNFDTFGGAPLTFNAPLAGNSNLTFHNEVDHVTLGNGNNTVVLGGGNDDIHVGSGSNTITGGTGQDDIFFAAHSAATVDTVRYTAANESQFSLPDIVTGFNQATDKIDLPFAINAANFAEVSSDAAVAATIAALNAGGPSGPNVVLNITTGHLFIDADASGTLTLAQDMEINLVGVTHLTAATFV
jgi:hypothetical protein